jgi:hypothetical protein
VACNSSQPQRIAEIPCVQTYWHILTARTAALIMTLKLFNGIHDYPKVFRLVAVVEGLDRLVNEQVIEITFLNVINDLVF